jgi:hypothetical protein
MRIAGQSRNPAKSCFRVEFLFAQSCPWSPHRLLVGIPTDTHRPKQRDTSNEIQLAWMKALAFMLL